MIDNIPCGINRLSSMFLNSGQVSTQRNGRCVRAVPEPYHKNIWESIRAAWWVFTGKAEAVIWPKAGDLEDAIGKDTMGEPLELPYKNWRNPPNQRICITPSNSSKAII